jgi:hypothetical protein
MIKKTISASISGVETPYTYTFSSGSSLISFSNQTGTSSAASLSTEINYPDEDSIGLYPITLRTVSAKGCTTAKEFNLTSPCNMTGVTQTQSGYKVTRNVSAPGCTACTFTWAYDAGVLNLVSQVDNPFSSTATFEPVTGRSLPGSTVVTSTATDCNGCTLSSSSNFVIGTPSITVSNNIYIDCPNDEGVYQDFFDIQFASSSTPIDPNSLDVGFTASNVLGVTITPGVPNANSARVRFFQSQVPVVENGSFTVYAKDIYGVPTSVAGTITVAACSRVGNIRASTIIPTATSIPTTVLSGDTISIPVTAKVASIIGADWNTAQILGAPIPASPSIGFRTTPEGEQVIDYEYAGVDDLFAWTLDDMEGNTIAPSTVSITALPAPPVANTDNVDMVIGETEIIDVLSNDTSSVGLVSGTLRIVTQSTSGGTAVANSDGTITYTSDVTDTGGTIVQYKVNDIYGQESSTGSVIITRISAGNGSENNLCSTAGDSVGINLFDLLIGTRIVNTTGTWSNLGTASPSPAAPVLYNDEVIFTEGTDAEGTHTYRYTVTSGAATDYQDVVVEFITYSPPSNDECAGATVLSFSGRGGTSTLSDQNLAATCPGYAVATLSATPIPSSWGLFSYASDVWYAFTATPYYDSIALEYLDYPILITINGANYGVDDGMFASAVAVYDGTCGALVERSANVADVNAQNITAQVTMSGSTAKNYFIRVSSVDGYEGKYSVTLRA